MGLLFNLCIKNDMSERLIHYTRNELITEKCLILNSFDIYLFSKCLLTIFILIFFSFLFHPIYSLSRVPTLEVAPHGNAYLRLWFNSSASSASHLDVVEVFLFLNDETGQSEESFQFTIRSKN